MSAKAKAQDRRRCEGCAHSAQKHGIANPRPCLLVGCGCERFTPEAAENRKVD